MTSGDRVEELLEPVHESRDQEFGAVRLLEPVRGVWVVSQEQIVDSVRRRRVGEVRTVVHVQPLRVV